MIRHTVLFGWNEHAKDADKARAMVAAYVAPVIGRRAAVQFEF